jgi:hypothetical protein
MKWLPALNVEKRLRVTMFGSGWRSLTKASSRLPTFAEERPPLESEKSAHGRIANQPRDRIHRGTSGDRCANCIRAVGKLGFALEIVARLPESKQLNSSF